MSDLIYLYGFVPADTFAPAELTGIGGRSVQLVETASLKAVVSEVAAAEYAPELVEGRLQDLEWVAAQGVAHERVVAWFVDHAQILPAPLFTMYSSADVLHATAAERMANLTAEMQRLRGLREWDLKVFFDQARLEQHAGAVMDSIAELDAEIAAAPAGRKYLLQKKRADVLKTELRQAAHQRAVAVLNEVSKSTADTRTLPLPRTSETMPVILHAALLVPTAHEAQVVAQLEQQGEALRAIGMDLAFSGPWAPYRFMGDNE